MNVIIRSGSNQIHGSAYEMHRDAALDASNFFENAGGVPKAPFIWNEFGATIGGPISIPHLYDGRNRTFFFAGYDGSRLGLGTTLNGNSPTPGQISQATALVQSQGITPNQLGLNILGLYKSLGLSGPFVVDNHGSQAPNSGVLKIDHKISESDSLSARYLHGEGQDQFPGGGPGPGGGSQLEPWFGVTPTVADNFAISEVHIFNTRLDQHPSPGLEPIRSIPKGPGRGRKSRHHRVQHWRRSDQLRHTRDRSRRHRFGWLFEPGAELWRRRPRGDQLPNRQ